MTPLERAAVRRAAQAARSSAEKDGSVHEAFVIGVLVLTFDLLGYEAGAAVREILTFAYDGALDRANAIARCERALT